MKFRALLLSAFVLLLTACQDQQARQRNAELTQRVQTLEAEVKALKAAQRAAPDAQQVSTQAAAQNCANALALTLETFHRDSLDHRYPAPDQLQLPDACAGQRLNWLKLEAQGYTFSLTGESGQELTRQSGP